MRDSVDTSITDVRLSSTDARDRGSGKADFVEQCMCPKGYTGLSCEVNHK